MPLTKSDFLECIQYVYDGLTVREIIDVPSSVINDLVEKYEIMASNVRPISAGEKCIVSFLRPKSAALFCDRVWSINTIPDYESIAIDWNFPIEIRTHALLDLYIINHKRQFGDSAALPKEEGPYEEAIRFIGDFEKDLAHDYRQRFGANVVSMYHSTAQRDAQYLPGNEPVIIAIAEDLAIVDEDALSWEQVMEFRNDNEIRTAYRTFIHWLDKEMVNKPASYIVDEILIRLERYEWALRKHGVQTVTGVLSTTFDPKFLVGTSATSTAIDFITKEPIWSLLAAGALLVGRASLSLTKVLLKREDIKHTHSEIIYVHEIKRLSNE